LAGLGRCDINPKGVIVFVQVHRSFVEMALGFELIRMQCNYIVNAYTILLYYGCHLSPMQSVAQTGLTMQMPAHGSPLPIATITSIR
jgi:hypothetical protein